MLRSQLCSHRRRPARYIILFQCFVRLCSPTRPIPGPLCSLLSAQSAASCAKARRRGRARRHEARSIRVINSVDMVTSLIHRDRGHTKWSKGEKMTSANTARTSSFSRRTQIRQEMIKLVQTRHSLHNSTNYITDLTRSTF